jgi:two-component system, response regulator, stage 0 sporulation protein F
MGMTVSEQLHDNSCSPLALASTSFYSLSTCHSHFEDYYSKKRNFTTVREIVLNKLIGTIEGAGCKMSKVLIVDDQYGIRVLLQEVLDKEGYTIFQAPNGQTALEIVRKEKPDLVLLDMKIPGMDGLEILRHIRSIEPDTKVIMMTAYGELDLIKEASTLGALTHFTKPFDIDELRDCVNHYLKANNKSVHQSA